MEWCNSPNNFIDFGWYYLVAAALQRRVWCGPEHRQLYPNMYGILCAEPGVGKGDVIKPVATFLKHHTIKHPGEKAAIINKPTTLLSDQEKFNLKTTQALEKEQYIKETAAEEKLNEGKDIKIFEKPLAIPVASDAVTYEALVNAMARSLRVKNYLVWNEKEQQNKMDIYTHSSLCFCLEEISSLFRKKTDDLVHFLLQAYDCGDYNYETIRRGKDRIRKCCLNFFGGTTPGFMQSVFNDQLLTEGFASRTFFLFAAKNRKSSLYVPELTPEQIQAKEEILEHIGKLIELYGHVKFTTDTWLFLEDWWQKAQIERPNTNIKLNPYYARKNIHVQKIAMAMHFGESTEMIIDVPIFERALAWLATQEKNMHFCLGLDQNNPLAKVKDKIVRFILQSNKPVRHGQLMAEFWDSFPTGKPEDGLKDILEHIEVTGKIQKKMDIDPITKQPVITFIGMKQSEI